MCSRNVAGVIARVTRKAGQIGRKSEWLQEDIGDLPKSWNLLPGKARLCPGDGSGSFFCFGIPPKDEVHCK